MKPAPLFKKEMYQAIVEGRKTQTRRIIKHLGNCFHYNKLLGEWGCSDLPRQWDGEDNYAIWQWVGKRPPKKGDWIWQLQCEVDDSCTYPIPCRYQVGDICYIREPFRVSERDCELQELRVIYKHDEKPMNVFVNDEEWIKFCQWKKPYQGKSSLYMFRSLAREFIKITGVRVERLQDISEADIWAEGISKDEYECWVDEVSNIRCAESTLETPTDWFIRLWNGINGETHLWESNPWVFVYEFERTGR